MLGTLDRGIIQLAFAPPGWTTSRALDAGGDLQLKVPDDIPAGALVVLIPGYDAGLGPILAAVPSNRLNPLIQDPHAEAQESITRQMGRRVVRGLGLTAYLRSPAALVLRDVVSRQDVITYVANKLGGAHFDPRREGKASRRHAILDKTLGTISPANGPRVTFVYGELLSIAEAPLSVPASLCQRRAVARGAVTEPA
jgi:hypothetical protein